MATTIEKLRVVVVMLLSRHNLMLRQFFGEALTFKSNFSLVHWPELPIYEHLTQYECK